MSQTVVGNQNLIAGRDIVIQGGFTPPSVPADRGDLLTLARRVRQFWIEGVLEHSLHGAARLAIGKETRLEAVAHPWENVLELPDRTPRRLPSSSSPLQVFTDVGSALLILGDPGSGKTTTLLELARDLIAGVEQDPTKPVPVVLNLSTWGTRRLPMAEWIVEELRSKYTIPSRIGSAWLAGARVLPLLDALDEVTEEARTACLESINRLSETAQVPGLAVTCRTQEYTVLTPRLRLNGAIVLQPLKAAEVVEYVAQAGPRLAALRQALSSDAVLAEMASSPLMLDIMTLAYQDAPLDRITASDLDTIEARRDRVFALYYERMFERPGKLKPPFPKARTGRWLAWLASQMARQAQSLFLIEQLQPTWLRGRLAIGVYLLLTRVSIGLILGFSQTLFMGDGSLGLAFGLCAGLAAAIIDMVEAERAAKRPVGSGRPVWLTALSFGLWPLLCGALGWMLAMTNWWSFESDIYDETLATHVLIRPSGYVVVGLTWGVIAGLFFGLRGRRWSLDQDIQPAESLRFSWLGALRGLACGVAAAIFLQLVVMAEEWVVSGSTPTYAWDEMFVFGNFYMPIGVVFGALRSNVSESKTRPNQGMWLSARNACIVTCAIAVFLPFVFEAELRLQAAFGLEGGGVDFTIPSLVAGVLPWSVLGIMWFGGTQILKHGTLRALMSMRAIAPWALGRFLEFAVRLILLRRVGGGYVFVHRLMLEHFAARHRPSTS